MPSFPSQQMLNEVMAGVTRHYPGPVPVTATWCDECYNKLPTVPVMMRLYQVPVVFFLPGVGALIWALLR